MRTKRSDSTVRRWSRSWATSWSRPCTTAKNLVRILFCQYEAVMKHIMELGSTGCQVRLNMFDHERSFVVRWTCTFRSWSVHLGTRRVLYNLYLLYAWVQLIDLFLHVRLGIVGFNSWRNGVLCEICAEIRVVSNDTVCAITASQRWFAEAKLFFQLFFL